MLFYFLYKPILLLCSFFILQFWTHKDNYWHMLVPFDGLPFFCNQQYTEVLSNVEGGVNHYKKEVKLACLLPSTLSTSIKHSSLFIYRL